MPETTQYLVEVVMIPLSDLDRAKHFYTKTLGFPLDEEFEIGGGMRFVLVTPPGSPCSLAFGTISPIPSPGDLPRGGRHRCAARAELVARGVEVDEIVRFTKDGPGSRGRSRAPDYGSVDHFSDPDGNTFMLQEVPSRGER